MEVFFQVIAESVMQREKEIEEKIMRELIEFNKKAV
jgi:hypothetical protein